MTDCPAQDSPEHLASHCVHCLRAELDTVTAERDRLKRGDFTTDEFQALCHHRDERPRRTRHPCLKPTSCSRTGLTTYRPMHDRPSRQSP